MKSRLLLPLLVFPLLAPGPVAPPGEIKRKVRIVVSEPGENKIPIALPAPSGSEPEEKAFHDILVRDLTLSGWFEVISSDAYIEPDGAGLQPGQFKYEDWEVPGAAALAKTGLARKGSALRSEVWVYDVAGRRKIGAKAFSAEPKALRTLAHKTANEIIVRITGEQGLFNTRFAAVKKAGNKEIVLVDFDGHGLTPITRNGSINIQPAWSPSGSKLAFTSYVAGNPDLFIADLSRGKIERKSSRSGINTGASWSPDGGRLALTLSPSGDPEIYVIDAATGKQSQRLTNQSGIEVAPAWSPDGRQIAFASERSGGAQIYVMGADGSGARRVTYAGDHNTDPAWSPDGRSLAYVSRSDNFDILVIRADGSGRPQRITQDSGNNEDPTWSPDGRYIAFTSNRSGGTHIWMSTLDGAHQVQLTTGRGGYSNPTWSPVLSW